MRHPTAPQVREHVALQQRLFRSVGGCVLTGRSAECPTCKARRTVYDLPSTGVVGCATCGTEFRVGLVTRSPEPEARYCPNCDVIAVPGNCCRESERRSS